MKLGLWPQRHGAQRDPLADWFDALLEHHPGRHLPRVFRDGMLPPANISENEKEWVLELEMPGLKEADIDVQMLGRQCLIKAERRFDEDKQDKEFHRVEHCYGQMSRSFELPSGLDPEQVDALYQRGILTLRFPKVEPRPSARVKVRGGEG